MFVSDGQEQSTAEKHSQGEPQQDRAASALPWHRPEEQQQHQKDFSTGICSTVLHTVVHKSFLFQYQGTVRETKAIYCSSFRTRSNWEGTDRFGGTGATATLRPHLSQN